MGIRDRIANAGRALVRQDAAPMLPPWPESPRSRSDAKLLERLDRGDSLLNELTGLGGANDKGTAGRPNLLAHRLDELELTALHLNNALAKRIVNLIPDDEGRRDWRIADGTDDVDILGDSMTEFEVKDNFVEARQWARLYGGSIIVMVTEDEKPPGLLSRQLSDEDHLRLPLDLDRVRAVKALHVLDSLEAWPLTYQTRYTSPGFRDPELWQIAPSGPVAFSGGLVHHSRVLWFRGAKRPPSWRYSAFGFGSSGLGAGGTRSLDDSILQAMWEEIRNLTSTMQGGAAMAQELRESVLKVAGLKGLMTGDQAAATKARIRLIARAKAILGIIVLGEGDEYSSRANPPTGFAELSSGAQSMVSMATGYPQTILFGTTPSGLSTDNESGRQTYDRLVDAQTEKHIRPNLTRFADVMFHAKEGPTKGQVPEDWSATFGPITVPTAAEEATTRKTTAETDAIYINTGVLDPEQVADSRFGPDGYQIEILTADAEDLDADGDTDTDTDTDGDDLDLDDPVAAAAALAELGKPAGARAAATAGDVDVQKAALNGAQVTAAGMIITQVATRQLPVDAGLGQLMVFYNMTEEEAGRAMGTVGTKFFVGAEARADQADSAPTTGPGPDGHIHGVSLEGPVATIQPGGNDGHAHAVKLGADETAPAPDGHTHRLPPMMVAALSATALAGDGEKVWLTLDLTPAGVRQYKEHLKLVEAAVGKLEPVAVPHVTVLYIGEVPAEDRRELLATAARVASHISPVTLHGFGVSTFPAGEDGTPVIIGVDGMMFELEHRLLRELAQHVTARQHDQYRPHVTLGFAPEPLDGTQIAKLEELANAGVGRSPYYDDDKGTWKPVVVAELVARAGNEVLARMPLGVALNGG